MLALVGVHVRDECVCKHARGREPPGCFPARSMSRAAASRRGAQRGSRRRRATRRDGAVAVARPAVAARCSRGRRRRAASEPLGGEVGPIGVAPSWQDPVAQLNRLPKRRRKVCTRSRTARPVRASALAEDESGRIRPRSLANRARLPERARGAGVARARGGAGPAPGRVRRTGAELIFSVSVRLRVPACLRGCLPAFACTRARVCVHVFAFVYLLGTYCTYWVR